MIKRTNIVNMLKAINIEKIENDGPSSIFLTPKGGKGMKNFSLSIQNEFIIVTTGKFLFKRTFKIHKNEL